jgi:hypothetical protein
MKNKFLTKARVFTLHSLGFHTGRKIICFDSDDWGSIRTPSKSVLENIVAEDPETARNVFLRNDTLENDTDLDKLANVLSSFGDCRGRHPCFTLNFAVANPKFELINPDSGDYHYETFVETYSRYFGSANRVFSCIQNGVANRVFWPQLHCREHIFVNRWLLDLQNGKKDVALAYRAHTIDVGSSFQPSNRFGYMDAFHVTNPYDWQSLFKSLDIAQDIFTNIFGFRSTGIVCPCFVWNSELETYLRRNGFLRISTSCWQLQSSGDYSTEKLKRVFHYTGERKHQIQFCVRNVEFEPSQSSDLHKLVEESMNQISYSFKHKKPVVIDTHRMNYVSSLSAENEEKGINAIALLLTSIHNTYPDVEFMSLSDLAEFMAQ